MTKDLLTPLSFVIEIYAVIREAAKTDLMPGTNGNFSELSIKEILTFLEGYREDLEYSLRVYDFHKNKDSDEIHQSLFQNNGNRTVPLLRSFNRIFKRKEGKKYFSEIHLDTHNNYCWARFAVLKEACHVLFVLENEGEHPSYPYTLSDTEVRKLFKSIYTLPFSVLDFESEGYSLELKIENAAEILAYLLMVGHDRILSDREELQKLETSARDEYDYFPLADMYKVPRRYTELFLSDEIVVGGVLTSIEARLSGSAFETVPAPPPNTKEKEKKNTK